MPYDPRPRRDAAKPLPHGWGALVEASAKPPEPEAEPSPALPSHAWVDRWARVREEARRLGGDNIDLGHLLWVDRACVDAGLHGLSRWWLDHYAAFYASGAFEDVARVGLRGAKSDAGARAVAAETVLQERVLAPTVEARCPIMSANITEASDRFTTVKVVLRAMGYTDHLSRGPCEPGGFKGSGGGVQAQMIQLHDAQGHEVKFQVSAASEAAAAGFTGIAGLCDELDLWGRSTGANPAEKVLRVLRSRYATQPQARLHLVSASYERESEHARLIGLGDEHGQRVARIGEDGAAADHAARLALAAAHGLTDTILLASPLPPDSPDVPSWVTNPVMSIEAAYARSKGNLREMFALYGGRGASIGAVSTWEPAADSAALRGRYYGMHPGRGDDLADVWPPR
jgi:hypothetical protein